FDIRLTAAAEQAGIPVWRRSRVLRLTHPGNTWHVDIVQDGQLHAMQASFVVDATGKKYCADPSLRYRPPPPGPPGGGHCDGHDAGGRRRPYTRGSLRVWLVVYGLPAREAVDRGAHKRYRLGQGARPQPS